MKYLGPKSFHCLVFLLLLTFAGPRASASVTVSIGKNFIGSSYITNSQFTPPDANGAIGPGRFMEFINGTVAVYNKTNGASVQRKSNLKFWSDAGILLSPDQLTTDPRVIYDPQSQRWFATQVDFDQNATDPTTEANDFLLAVSTTSSPTGPWKAFLFQADPDNGYFADFPTLGVDSNAVYISGDFFSAGEMPAGAGLLSMPKADLIAAVPTIANLHWYGVMDYTERGEVLQPAICFDGSASGSILSVADIGNDSNPHSNLVCFAVQDGGGTNAALTASTFLDVLPYEVPDNADLGVPQFVAHQPDGTTTLMANDARLSAKVYAVNGVLYAVHNTFLDDRLAIRWYRIRASDQVVLEQGTIADTNLDLFFPSIAANANGVVVIACNGSSGNTLINSYAYVGEIQSGITTFGAGVLLKAGSVNYHDINEIIAQLVDDPETPSRWGDYSSISIDPADPTRFWTIQTIPTGEDDSGVGVWTTQITEIIATQTTAAAPQLTVSVSGTNVLVSWPFSAANYQLQSTTNLVNKNGWTLFGGTIATNGPNLVAQVSRTKAAEFFRLQGP